MLLRRIVEPASWEGSEGLFLLKNVLKASRVGKNSDAGSVEDDSEGVAMMKMILKSCCVEEDSGVAALLRRIRGPSVFGRILEGLPCWEGSEVLWLRWILRVTV